MSGSENTGSTGGQAGNSIGEGIKGVFNTIGGAGESIRGNFNNFVDQAGEGLASNMGSKEEQEARQAKLGQEGSGTKVGENADIASKGEEQVKRGINQLTGQGSTSSGGSTN
ncbi:hypothetical protein BDZ90DRAFT_280438 [Jaminaea rosea]|uniref:Uncharacterized protein n=1 Tax=Jaminaea rosea TaxID=1569628 RepID=A0A316UTH4_9BASI|nr:hypothetical protein BDZ90DRAFT_280438 [Jaminaea rosea]PWN26395.1 hypothetical protein BDZ90DRAFT_280438 [Jaminaea rosea]